MFCTSLCTNTHTQIKCFVSDLRNKKILLLLGTSGIEITWENFYLPETTFKNDMILKSFLELMSVQQKYAFGMKNISFGMKNIRSRHVYASQAVQLEFRKKNIFLKVIKISHCVKFNTFCIFCVWKNQLKARNSRDFCENRCNYICFATINNTPFGRFC